MRFPHEFPFTHFLTIKIRIMKLLNSLVLIILFSSLILFYNSISFAGDIVSDSLALVALYDSTNGDSWDNSTGWKTAALDTWYGIEINNGRVENIYLQGNNLVGNIPPAIGDLDSLKRLYFNGNSSLTDSLPSELGNLSKLERLYIYSCNLTGSIPPELGNMTNITEIALDRNSLTDSIPSTLGNLSNLTYLSLDQNNLSESIPSEIGNISNLQYLLLNDNNLIGEIPTSLGNLSNLLILRLLNNQLIGSIPTQLGDLSQLEYLQLSNNQLTGGIPVELANLSNLESINLSYNPIGGTIPPELGTMSNLQYLYAANCQLTGTIPGELADLDNLLVMDFGINQLSDNLPIQIADMTNLQTLNFYYNQLSGEIPPDLGNMTSLEQLSLGSNDFSGNIPPSLGNLSNLIYLELYGNELTGTIPPELGNLTNLLSFVISENQLSGSIPPELGNLSNLSRFYVQNNELTGAVPEELTDLTNLSRIHIRYNDLEDLPDFSGLTLLEEFHVEENKFTFGDLEPNIALLDSYSPQDSIGISDTIYFAIEDTLQLEIQTDGLYNNYQWTHNGGGITDNDLYNGTNDSVLFIRNPSATDAGAYSCDVTNDVVTGLTLISNPVYLLPTVKVTSLPEDMQCVNSTIEIGYKSIEVSPGNVFTLVLSDSLGSFDTPVVLASIATTDSIGMITVDIPGDLSTSDQYRVRINASNPSITGIPSESTLQILNRTLSNPVITPSGDVGICGDESIVLSTEPLVFLHYIWYQNDEVIEGATSYSITVNEDGTYYVRIYDACTIDSLSSNTVTVTVNPLPEVYLSLEGTLLTATYDQDYSYTWYKDGVDLMLDESTYEYVATENGEYLVDVIDENGCNARSNSQIVNSITSIDNIISSMQIFPNPTDGKVYITLTKNIAVKRITVTHLSGKVVYDNKNTIEKKGDQFELDLSNQNPGFYIVSIKTNEGSAYFKLLRN